MPNGRTKVVLWQEGPAPWQTVMSKSKQQGMDDVRKEPYGIQDADTQWWCGSCKAPHYNNHKQTCRICSAPRAPPPKVPGAPQGRHKEVVGNKVKSQPVSKLVARHLLTKGITLSTTNLEEVCPVAKPRTPDDPPKKLGEMSTDALNSALVALSALHFPEAALKPFRDVIEERAALEQQKVDNGKLLEQLTQAKNQKVKLRDAVKAEVDLLQQRLDAKRKEPADFEADVERLQVKVNSLMVDTAVPTSCPKRAGDTVQGLSVVKLFLVQDDNALATAEYLTYKAEKQAAGQVFLDPLRWHLYSQVGTLDETEQGPPAKRTCTSGVAGEHMQEEL